MESAYSFTSEPRSEALSGEAPLSRGLGWFSVALGLTEIALPKTLAAVIGVEPRNGTRWVMRTIGVREVLAGLGVLIQPHRPRPLWARVAGDAVDLALLGASLKSPGLHVARIAGALAAVAGVTALDLFAARRAQRRHDEANRPVIFGVTINKPPSEVYAFFRRLSQLPLFMDYLESVRESDSRYSHWVARLPAGGTISWDAKITEDRPGEAIAWRSVQGSLIETRGRVTFTRTPGRNMTEVRVEMQLSFLGTRPSASVARFFTRSQVKGDLRRLKQVLETGEVLHSDASAHRRPHPAQPAPAGKPGSKVEQSHLPFIPPPPTAPIAHSGARP